MTRPKAPPLRGRREVSERRVRVVALREKRDSKIHDEYQRGASIEELSVQHGLTYRYVREIIHAEIKKRALGYLHESDAIESEMVDHDARRRRRGIELIGGISVVSFLLGAMLGSLRRRHSSTLTQETQPPCTTGL